MTSRRWTRPLPSLLPAARLVAMLALASLVLGLGGHVARSEPEHAALIIDANTGAILHEASSDTPRRPASLTKMMTLYLVFEQIEAGRMSYSTKIKISQEASSAAPSKLDLDPGEEIETLAAIKALITKSANDVAIALAEHISGSEAAFARLMTERARQIGMRNSVFRNASGLPDPAQVTTARDMITLALRLQDEYPRHYTLFQTRAFTYEGNSYRNHNTLLVNYQGTDGIKTGYTRMSGFNLVASVHRNGRHLIGAVFGGSSAGSRDAHMRMLLTRAFPRASAEKTRRSAPLLVARGKPVPQPVPALRPRPEPRIARSPPPDPTPSMSPPMPVEISRGRLAMTSSSSAPSILDAPRASVSALQRSKPPPVTPPRALPAARDERNLPWLKPSTAAQDDPNRRATAPPARAPAPAIAHERVKTVAAAPQSAARVPVAVAASPPVAASAGAGRGVPPSSLQAQADRLALGGPSGTALLRSSALPPNQATVSTRTEGRLDIQVGAYPSTGEAERQISSVRTKTGSLLKSYPPQVIPVQRDNRLLYRARFTGFEANSAAAACLELRRLMVDCFVMRAE